MTLPAMFERYRTVIEDGLVEALQGTSPPSAILRYHVGLEDESGKKVRKTGKLLRPSLVLFTAEELGASLNEGLPAALALEMIHNFSLIHDDIQDQDEMRRGRPSVWRRFGIAQGINAGDLLLVKAIDLVQGLPKTAQITKALLTATCEMIEGQVLDVAFEGQDVGIESYLTMVEKKTGALIHCAFQLGALAASSPPEVLESVCTMGLEIGKAFQICDDLLGVWGDGEITGKPQGSDIRRKKTSLPVVVAFAQAGEKELEKLRNVYKKTEILDEDVANVVAVMDELNIRSLVEERIHQQLARARDELGKIPFTSRGMQDMEGLLDYLARREK